MDSMEALHLAELLCSRICHDLSGPVGAAAAGAELVAEGGSDDGTLELVATSAAAASARLAYLRAAFGSGSTVQRTAGLRNLTEKYFASLANGAVSAFKLDWRITEAELPFDAARLVLNLIMTARDALPRGGIVMIEARKTDQTWVLNVAAEGSEVRVADDASAVLLQDVVATGPRGAQTLLLKILAARLGLTMQVLIEPTYFAVRMA